MKINIMNNKSALNEIKINSNQKNDISARDSNVMLILITITRDSLANLYRIRNKKNSAQKHSGFTRYSI